MRPYCELNSLGVIVCSTHPVGRICLLPEASSEIELAELDHVSRTQPEQAAGSVQPGGVGAPVEAGSTS